MSKSALIIFAKNQKLGHVKTRLAVSIGDQEALEVYQQLLQRTKEVTLNSSPDKFVFYSQHIEEGDLWEEPIYRLGIQSGDGLGERMLNAFEQVFKQGYTKVCIIGTDCYDLSQEHIEEAFLALDKSDFVIGPAMDGGYYLIGMNKLYPELFKGKVYSTHSVFQEAKLEIQKLSKQLYLLDELSDIDTVEDLRSVGLLKNS